MNEFQIRLNRRNISEAELIADLQECAASLGFPNLKAKQYDENGTFNSSTAIRTFGTWNRALEKAGIPIGSRMNIDDEELFQNFADVWIRKGNQPSGNDIDGRHFGSLFSKNTYKRRFGSWNKALLTFSDHIGIEKVGKELNGASDAEFKTPQIARHRTPREINWHLRAKVLIKHSCICQMCGDSPAKNPDTVLHVDHILAWANGGETVEDNLQTLCAKCNIGKSDQLLPGQDAC